MGPHRRSDRPRLGDPHRHPAGQGRGAGRPGQFGRPGVHRAQGGQQHPRTRRRAQQNRRLRQHGCYPDHDRVGSGRSLECSVQPEEAPGDARADRASCSRLLRRPDGGAQGPEARQSDRRATPDRDVPDA